MKHVEGYELNVVEGLGKACSGVVPDSTSMDHFFTRHAVKSHGQFRNIDFISWEK